MISARTIVDSVSPHGSRLFTVLCRYPKFVHAEHCRHRSFSFSVSSSRAIPVAKSLEEVRSDKLRATPVWWGQEQKGMASGEELSDEYAFNGSPVPQSGLFAERGKNAVGIQSRKRMAWEDWRRAAHHAADVAEKLKSLGTHKSIVNRILEPFLHVNVLCTGTTDGWMNFFGLRLDRAAQPEMRMLAEAIWREWNEHESTRLEPGQWHLPFVEEQDNELFNGSLRKISVARCARLSYMSFATQRRSTVEEDLTLYDRLVASRHWSPLEHIATPDEVLDCGCGAGFAGCLAAHFAYPAQAGNLGLGWRQYRKMMSDEAVAALPEGYETRQ